MWDAGLGLALALTVAVAGCSVSVDGSGARFRCEHDDPCPPGLSCAPSGYCEPPATSHDGSTALFDGSGSIDALPSAYASAVMADSPILYYRLSDDTLVAHDSSGYLRHGAYTSTVDRDTAGALSEDDGAAAFDEDGDRIEVEIDEDLLLIGDFTIEFWARRLGVASSSFPGIVRYGNAGATGYLVYYEDRLQELILKRSGQDFHATFNGEIAATFQHYAVTFDSSTGTLVWYVNGVFNDDYAGLVFDAPQESALTVEVGRGDTSGDHVIDELAIYDKALAEDRIAAHFAAAQ